MVDTGINRLGIAPADVKSGLLDGLQIETLMSHLACADEDKPSNEKQRRSFADLAGKVRAKRLSLANSAGICLGADYAFDLTRPGLALYGGVPRREAEGHIRQVARVEAEIVQRRRIEPGDSVGYNATFTAERRLRAGGSSTSAMATVICAASRAPVGGGSATASRRSSGACRWT